MSVRRPLIAVVAAVATMALSACSVTSTNFSAETNRAYDAAKGVNSRDTPVGVHNALLVDNTTVDASGRAVGDSGSNATLSAALINHTDQAVTLTGVTAQSAAGEPLSTQFAGDSGSIGLNPAEGADVDRRALVMGVTDAELVVELGELRAGANVTLTFEFEGIDDIILTGVPVVSRQDPIFAAIVNPNSGSATGEDAPGQDPAGDAPDPDTEAPATDETGDEAGQDEPATEE